MVPWLDFWRDFWKSPDARRCGEVSQCRLDELSRALEEYLESARGVAAGAAKNVDDAERIMAALQVIIERKRAAKLAAEGPG